MKKLYYLLILFLLFTTLKSQTPGGVISYSKKLDLTPEGVLNYIYTLNNKDIPKDLISYISQFSTGLVAYKITYYTTDNNNKPIKATGLIMYPKVNYKLSTLVYCHPTTDHRNNVPSNLRDVIGMGFLIPLGYTLSGYILIAPDYIGMGDGEGQHLYVNAQTEANATIDMMKASQTILSELKVKQYNEYFLAGYSQGGHAAMSTLKMLKEKYNNLYTFKYAHLGSGPYDLSDATLNKGILQKKTYPFSSFLANIIYSCHASGYSQYTLPQEIIAPEYIEKYNENVLREKGGLFWGPLFWEKLFKPEYISNVRNNTNHPLRKCFENNNVYRWYNQTPTTLGYASIDITVPNQNSKKTETAQRSFYPWFSLKKYQIKTQNYGPVTHVGGAAVHFLASVYKFNTLRSGGFFNQYAIISGKSSSTDLKTSFYESSLLYPDLYLKANEIEKISSFSTESKEMKKVKQLSNLDDGVYLLKINNSDNSNSYVPLVKDTPLEIKENEIIESENTHSIKLKSNDEDWVRINIFNSNLNFIKSISATDLALTDNIIETSDLSNDTYTFEVMYPTYSIMFKKDFNSMAIDNFKVYTSNQTICIQSFKDVASVDVFNIHGNNVWSYKNKSLQKEISSQKLNAGIYFVKIQFTDGSHKTNKVNLY